MKQIALTLLLLLAACAPAKKEWAYYPSGNAGRPMSLTGNL